MSAEREREALFSIMREASYLPIHSPERKAIEDAASQAILSSLLPSLRPQTAGRSHEH